LSKIFKVHPSKNLARTARLCVGFERSLISREEEFPRSRLMQLFTPGKFHIWFIPKLSRKLWVFFCIVLSFYSSFSQLLRASVSKVPTESLTTVWLLNASYSCSVFKSWIVYV